MTTDSREPEPTLWEWLVRPRAWSSGQKLALLSLGCVAASLLFGLASELLANIAGYAAFLLVLALMVLRWKLGASAAEPPSRERQPPSSPGSNLGFGVALALVLAAFSWLFLARPFDVEDHNMEAVIAPLMVGQLEIAREKGLSPKEYFNHDPYWANYLQQEPFWAYQCPGHAHIYEFIAYSQPVPCLLYLPIVRAVGAGPKAIAFYSTFFAALAWLSTGFLAWRMAGRWGAILAMSLFLTSLSWLIHTKIGYPHWMPCVVLMLALAGCLRAYLARPRRATLVGIGIILGILGVMGWIAVVFAVIMTALALGLLGTRPRFRGALHAAPWISGSLVVTAGAITLAYAAWAHCTVGNILGSLLDDKISRFSEGGSPAHPLPISGKIAFAFRCLFVDMQTFDHPDKYLEGHPAISWVFSALFLVGLLYAIKHRSVDHDLLLVWLVSSLGFLGFAFLFSHRYSLLAMPAMGILAARGALGLGSDLARWRGRWLGSACACAVAVLLGVEVVRTHHDYYVEYRLHKPPNLEVDRVRGHSQVAAWLRKNADPASTLVVLNDPIMCPSTLYNFHTLGTEYRFVFWSNYFGWGGAADQVKAWEKAVFAQYRKIIYVFSTQTYPWPQPNTPSNDWAPFRAAHPGLAPRWTWAYSDRPPSLLLYEVTAPAPAPAPPLPRGVEPKRPIAQPARR